MTDIQVTPPRGRSDRRWLATANDQSSDRFDPKVDKEVAKAAEDIGVTADQIRQAIDDHETSRQLGRKPVPFEVRVRGRKQRKDQARIFSNIDPAKALRQAIDADVSNLDEPMIEWDSSDDAVVLDLDRPEGYPVLQAQRIDGLFPEMHPRPLASWISHGGGLKAAFVLAGGESALALAGAWHLVAWLDEVAAYKVEAKTGTRHPAGLRDGGRCSGLRWFTPSAYLAVEGAQGQASLEDIEGWRAANGVGEGQHRVGHHLCPVAPSQYSGRDPVCLNDAGAFCHRCQGFRSWGQIVGTAADGRSPDLRLAARRFVHVLHQRHVLRTLRSSTPDELLVPAWGLMLRSANADRLAIDPATGDAEAPWAPKKVEVAALTLLSPNIARSVSGCWLNGRTLLPRMKLTMATARALPWAMGGPHHDEALDGGQLEGFTPLWVIPEHQVLAPYEEPPEGSVLVRRQERGAPPAIELGTRSPAEVDVEAAWAVLIETLPGLNRGFLSALIVIALVARINKGLPPIIVVTGPTGSGKTAHLWLAVAMLGTVLGQFYLDQTQEDTRRVLGSAVAAGASIVFADELGRVGGVYNQLGPILSLNQTLVYRRKHSNEELVEFRAMVVLCGSTLPTAITTAPEMSRRAIGFGLHETADAWDQRVGQLSELRHNERLRPHLDIITSALWWQVRALGRDVDWKVIARSYGGVAIEELEMDELELAGRAEVIRDLYQLFRSAEEKQMCSMKSYGHYLDASTGDARQLIEQLVDLDAPNGVLFGQTEDLARKPVNDVLGIDSPTLSLKVLKKSASLLVLFKQTRTPQGKGIDRRKLPELGDPPKISFAIEGEQDQVEDDGEGSEGAA